MDIKFSDKELEKLNDLLKKSSNEYIRIKVAFGCGKPYYEIFTDFKRDDDLVVEIKGINFIMTERDLKACKGITIVYDGRFGNNGFYVI